MMKMFRKKIKTIVYIIVVITIIAAGIFYYRWRNLIVKSNVNFYNAYPYIELTAEKVAFINTLTLDFSRNNFYVVKDPIQDLNNGEYGEIFDFVFRFSVEKKSKSRRYIVEMQPDYSLLDENEMIFWGIATSQGVSFNVDEEGGNVGTGWVSVSGCTYGYSREEIIEICKKVRIRVWIEDDNGRLTEKVLKPSSDVCYYDRDEYYDFNHLIGLFGDYTLDEESDN